MQRRSNISQKDFYRDRKTAVQADTVDTAILRFKYQTELLKMTFNTL